MSDESRPSTSTTPDEGITSDLPTTSSENAANIRDQSVVSNNGLCNCDFGTRKFTSVAYVAILFISGVVILVAANVDTDKKGISVDKLPVYRYLTVVLFIAILWMATSIFSKCFSRDFREKWLLSHIEPAKQLLPTRLLVGVMFFGLGSSFLTMVELLEFVAEYDCPSKDVTMLFYYTVRTIFIYTQLYFFYKLSSHSEKVLIFSHFLIMHLIAVNLGTWIVTFVYDSAEELNEGTSHNSTMLFMARHWGTEGNELDSAKNLTGCNKTKEVLKSTAEKMEPYLYTFTMEYCLISAGLLLNTWLSLHNSSIEQNSKNQNDVVEGLTSQNRDNREYKSQKSCQKGYKSKTGDHKGKSKGCIGSKQNLKGEHGNSESSSINFESDDSWECVDVPETMPEVGTLWRFGFILGLVYIPAFTAIVFNLLFTDDKQQDQLIYIGMQFFFFLSILTATCIGYAQLKKQKLGETHSQVDFILLGVSLVGVFLLDFFIVVASICEVGKNPAVAGFLIVTNITEVLCSIMFTLFVREALERELPADLEDTVVTNSASKIREIVSFLFMLNICFWVMYTFEVKKSNTVLDIVEDFYSTNVWFYLSHFVYPLAVFFHFHGAVCMVEILNHYSISKPRRIPSSSVSVSTSHPALQT